MSVTNIVSSNLGIAKQLEPYGVSIAEYQNAKDALGYTYTTNDGGFPPTPLFSSINPFNEDIRNAKVVLEIGAGVGRNLPIIMEQTSAHYYMVDPNEKMHEYFWDIQDHKYKDRVTLCTSFDQLPSNLSIDFVLVTFVFQHIGFRPSSLQMNVADITKEALKYCHKDTVWFVLEHEREESWQERWISECGIIPIVYFKPGGHHAGGGTIPYPEFASMAHRGNDNNLIIFKGSTLL